MASRFDPFDYSDGQLSAVSSGVWVNAQGSGMSVVSNEVSGQANGDGISVIPASVENFGNDGESEIEITTGALNSDDIGVVYRFSETGGNGYLAKAQASNVFLFEVTGNTQNQLSSTAVNMSAVGSKIKIKCAGTTISVETDIGSGFVEQISVTDANHTSGQPGLFYGRGNVGATRGDNFNASDTAGGTPTLSSVGAGDTLVLGTVAQCVYSNFTSPIDQAVINNGGSAQTFLTVSNATETTADLQIADFNAWVSTFSCPFTSTNQTTQQITITNTSDSESATLSVTFNPSSGFTVEETNSFTWPADLGKVISGFSSQPPTNSQAILPNGFNVNEFGTVKTDLNTDQTAYFYNSTTNEGSQFECLIESELGSVIMTTNRHRR